MSNRDQRTSPPEDYRDDLPAPSQSDLSDELAAVLKLLATQKSLTGSTESLEASSSEAKDEARRLGRDLGALHAADPSAAIDRLQDRISELNGRLSDGASDHPREEWDSSSAEALTRLYETSAFGLTQSVPHFEDASQARRGNVPFYAITPKPPRPNKRDWLEERFADIAAKLDSSLAEIRNNGPVQRLDGRLETMEARICEALQGLVTRSDLEHLRPAGSHFETMAGNIDRAAAQLSRLDTIEGNLETVLDRLSDDRLYIDAPAAAQPQIDFKALADATADSVVARLSQLGLGRVDSAELAEIRQSIGVIIDERRRHDEQSIAILDTLQQAMISVLDRVDALSQPQATNVESASHEAANAHHSSLAGKAGDDNRFDVSADDLGYNPASRSQWDEDEDIDPAASSSYLAPLNDVGELDDDLLAQAYPQPPTLPGKTDKLTGATATEGDLLSKSAVDRIRQELIAEAKRAKQQAAERPAKSSGARQGDALPKPRTPRPSSRQLATANANGTILGIQRRKLLVGAVIILFTTAGALMLLRATSADPNDEPSNIEQPLDAAPAAIGLPSHEQPSVPADGEMETPEQPSGTGQNDGLDPQNMPAESEQTGQVGTTPHLYDAPLADPARPLASNLSGVTVQNSGRTLTPDELAHLGERQAMAHFSTKLGEAAVQATPAALFPEDAAAADNSIASAVNPNAVGSIGGSRPPLNLPPASVGPMSLRLAAAQGDQSAEFEVGARLAEGKGTEQDFKEAARWYQRSAAQGFAQAQYRLGTLYERGLGTPKDLARAAVWYQRAAGSGNLKAMHNLAVLSSGQGTTEPDYETAARWFTAAAERGLSDSQYNLAVLLANGLGTPKDLKKAYMYFSLAAKSGDLEAKRRQETLRADFSVDDLSVAERMVETWRRKPSDRLANDARAAGEDWKSRADNSYNR